MGSIIWALPAGNLSIPFTIYCVFDGFYFWVLKLLKEEWHKVTLPGIKSPLFKYISLCHSHSYFSGKWMFFAFLFRLYYGYPPYPFFSSSLNARSSPEIGHHHDDPNFEGSRTKKGYWIKAVPRCSHLPKSTKVC